jgi:hypothetical protein
MRAGETVVVCGARADRGQFVPWVSVGCGNVTFLADPDDADPEAREKLARAYVDAVSESIETEREAAVVAVESLAAARRARVALTVHVARRGRRSARHGRPDLPGRVVGAPRNCRLRAVRTDGATQGRQGGAGRI